MRWDLEVLRSIGERGEAGDESNERPTCPMGEQDNRLGRKDPDGESGGRMAAFLKSRGVTGERK